ncbi:hypothetical protein ACFE04_002029 [Oxalis oulophora]
MVNNNIVLSSTENTNVFAIEAYEESPFALFLWEMECALKGSFRKEININQQQQQQTSSCLEDLYAVNNNNSCDEFFVDDLLDFSNDDVFVHEDNMNNDDGGIKEEEEINDFSSVIKEEEKFESTTIPTSDLVVPADDLAHLEWLSHFVDDSNSEYSAAAGVYTTFPEQKPVSFLAKVPKIEVDRKAFSGEKCFHTPVPAKARSKRTRLCGRVWSLGSLSFSESPSSSTSSSSSSLSSAWVVYPNTGSISILEPASCKPIVKRQKKKQKLATSETTTGGSGGGVVAQPPRRCSHCGVQKTPQWRTGPLGAKTLCNACGVRFKSGRLFPEYRPACSPTFSNDLHSNHHRKVVEMRRKKEVIVQTETGLSAPPPPAVPSF